MTRSRRIPTFVAGLVAALLALGGASSARDAGEEPGVRIAPVEIDAFRQVIFGPVVLKAEVLAKAAHVTQRQSPRARRARSRVISDDLKPLDEDSGCRDPSCFPDQPDPEGARDPARSPPLSDEPWQLNTGGMIDPQIAAGLSHLVVTLGSQIRVYTKGGSLLVNQSIRDFFKPLWDPANPTNINTFLNLPANIECDARDEFDFVSTTFCLDSWYDARVVYDEYRDRFWIVALARNSRTRDGELDQTTSEHTWEEEIAARRSKVVLAVSITGNPMDGFYQYWWNAVVDDGICNLPQGQQCPNSIFKPGDGGDYPSIGVSQALFMQSDGVSRRFSVKPGETDTKTRYGLLMAWDANALANALPAAGWGWYSGADTGSIRAPGGVVFDATPIPAHQHGPSPAALAFAANLWKGNLLVWAVQPGAPPTLYLRPLPLADPVNAARVAPQRPVLPFLDTPRPLDFANVRYVVMKAVYRNFRLHAVWPDCRTWSGLSECVTSNRLVRVDVSDYLQGPLPTSPAAGFIDRTFGRSSIDDPATAVVSYGNPGVEVNQNGDMVVVYNRSGESVFPEARYSVYFDSEADIRPSSLLRQGSFPIGANVNLSTDIDDDGNVTPVGHLDYAGIGVDPFDDTTVWMAHGFGLANAAPPGDPKFGGHWELAIGRVFGRPRPDLVTAALSVSPNAVEPGGLLQGNLKVRNQGDGNAAASQVGLFLSSDEALSPSDVPLGTLAAGALASEAQFAGTFAVALPNPIGRGPWRLLVVADNLGQVAEYDEGNNVASVPIKLRVRGRPGAR